MMKAGSSLGFGTPTVLRAGRFADIGNLRLCRSTDPLRDHRYHHRYRNSTRTKIVTASADGDRTILVFGGGSTLGTEVVTRFFADGWRVVTLDYYDASVECGGVNGCEIPLDDDNELPISLALPAGAPARTQASVALNCVRSVMQKGKVDVILNATLGYTVDGGNVFDAWEYMQKTSVESSLIAYTLAKEFLAEDGMLALLGSVAGLSITRASGLLGFACAKAATHQMVHQLAISDDIPKGASIVGLVPEVLDTPLHRSMNNDTAGENWTPCNVVAQKLLAWAESRESRPPSGALVSINTSMPLNDDEGKQHRFRLIEETSFVQPAQL